MADAKIILFVSCAFLAGCDENTIPVQTPAENEPSRFSVKFEGYLRSGVDSLPVYVLTDQKTGREYIAVRGCGTEELKKDNE